MTMHSAHATHHRRRQSLRLQNRFRFLSFAFLAASLLHRASPAHAQPRGSHLHSSARKTSVPRLSSLTPASGAVEGGTRVTLRGAGFERTGKNALRFSTASPHTDVAVVPATYIDSSTLVFTTPARKSAVPAHVAVSNDGKAFSARPMATSGGATTYLNFEFVDGRPWGRWVLDNSTFPAGGGASTVVRLEGGSTDGCVVSRACPPRASEVRRSSDTPFSNTPNTPTHPHPQPPLLSLSPKNHSPTPIHPPTQTHPNTHTHSIPHGGTFQQNAHLTASFGNTTARSAVALSPVTFTPALAAVDDNTFAPRPTEGWEREMLVQPPADGYTEHVRINMTYQVQLQSDSSTFKWRKFAAESLPSNAWQPVFSTLPVSTSFVQLEYGIAVRCARSRPPPLARPLAAAACRKRCSSRTPEAL